MPSLEHEALLVLFRNRPSLAPATLAELIRGPTASEESDLPVGDGLGAPADRAEAEAGGGGGGGGGSKSWRLG